MDAREIGRAVEYHRKRARITRKQLARMSGLSQSAIFHIEKGRPTMKLDSLMRLLNVLNMDLVVQGPLMHELSQPTSGRDDETGTD